VDLLVQLADELLSFHGRAHFALIRPALVQRCFKLLDRAVVVFNSLRSKIASARTQQNFLAIQIFVF